MALVRFGIFPPGDEMIYLGKLKKSTAITKLIGQLFSFDDSKSLLIDRFENGNDGFDPTLLKCILSKNVNQSQISLSKTKSDLIVTGNIYPDVALGAYNVAGELNGHPYYTNSNGFFIWGYESTDWVINDTLGEAEPGVGRFYSCFKLGDYAATGGFTGTANVQIGITNTINLVSGGLAEITLTAEDTDTIGSLIITLENVTEGNELIFPCGYLFDVVSAENSDLAGMIKDQIIECDCYYDTSTVPWQIIIHKKGDRSVVYARKNAFDETDKIITSKSQLVMKLSEPST
jgi:hypothetical protein